MIWKAQPNCIRWMILATCYVILSSQGTEARLFEFSNVTLPDFFSRLDFSQSFQQSKDSLLDWIKWILKISTAFLDPLYLGHMKIDYDDESIKTHWTGDAMTIRYLLQSRISNVTVEPDKLGVSANITFPKLKLQGVYNTSGRMDELEMDIFGKGLMAVTVTDLKVYGALRFTIGNKLSLKLEDLDYSVQGLEVLFDNLMGGGSVSDMLNGVASDLGTAAAQDFKANVTQIIMDKVNEALAHYVPQM